MRVLKGLRFAPAKGRIKAGKKKVLTLRISATSGIGGGARIRFKSSNRNVKVRAKVWTNLDSHVKVVVRATRKARGKATITASSGKFQSKARLTVKPLKKKKRR